MLHYNQGLLFKAGVLVKGLDCSETDRQEACGCTCDFMESLTDVDFERNIYHKGGSNCSLWNRSDMLSEILNNELLRMFCRLLRK